MYYYLLLLTQLSNNRKSWVSLLKLIHSDLFPSLITQTLFCCRARLWLVGASNLQYANGIAAKAKAPSSRLDCPLQRLDFFLLIILYSCKYYLLPQTKFGSCRLQIHHYIRSSITATLIIGILAILGFCLIFLITEYFIFLTKWSSNRKCFSLHPGLCHFKSNLSRLSSSSIYSHIFPFSCCLHVLITASHGDIKIAYTLIQV